MLVSFLHGFELLLQYGSRSFYMFLKNIIESESNSRMKTELVNNSELNELYQKLKDGYETDDAVKKLSIKPLRHPKLLKLEELILEHFQNFKDSTF